MQSHLRIASALLFVPMAVSAQIYRCETDQGPVFSDTECGAEAVVVELEDDSRGISMGPPEEVRAELKETRERWAEDLAAQREAQQAQLARAPQPPVVVERQIAVPAWGWGGPGLGGPGWGRPPGYRPRPPFRPEPLPPVAPPIRPPLRPPPVMRPPR